MKENSCKPRPRNLQASRGLAGASEVGDIPLGCSLVRAWALDLARVCASSVRGGTAQEGGGTGVCCSLGGEENRIYVLLSLSIVPGLVLCCENGVGQEESVLCEHGRRLDRLCACSDGALLVERYGSALCHLQLRAHAVLVSI